MSTLESSAKRMFLKTSAASDEPTESSRLTDQALLETGEETCAIA